MAHRKRTTPAPPPAIVAHHLAHAEAALAAAESTGIAVRIESAANAAAQGGALWFAEVIIAARKMHPKARFEAVLDCGPHAGRALGAIREFARHETGDKIPLAVRTRAPARARAKIAAIARSARVPLFEGARGRALDLLDAADPKTAAAACLAKARDDQEQPAPPERSLRRPGATPGARAKRSPAGRPASRLQKA